MKRLLLSMLVVGTTSAALAGPTSTTATLSWSAPTTREDTTALPVSQIGGYYIYINGVKTGALLPGLTTTTEACVLGTYQITAIDTSGHESKLSSPIALDVTVLPGCQKPPVAPSGFKAIAV